MQRHGYLHPDAPQVEPPVAVQKRMKKYHWKRIEEMNGTIMAEKLLEIKNLKQYFNNGKPNVVKAVDDISFDIYKGETLDLVGESGCGKSTTGRTIIRLYDATDGEVMFNGENVHGKKSKEAIERYLTGKCK